ncbi:MAG TPA: hypothetical protein VEA19_04140, partial [Actinomycetota bacterium]|nr:hypothetical protein [Actinomycetota bacterium]
EDVFVHDRERGRTSLVSISSEEEQGDGGSGWPSVSDDGRYVAFSSEAKNLVPGDTNSRRDIFVRDLVAGRTERVSIATDGTQANNVSVQAAISANGRYVGFVSDASNLVPGDSNIAPDVFVHDRTTRETEMVSVSSSGAKQDEGALYLDISGDGRFVVFSSYATNLDARDTNTEQDVYIHDRELGKTELVSMSNDGTAGDLYSREPVVSDDGRYVAYESIASNLVPGDTNGISDIFVRDRTLGRTLRVSVTGDGAQLASGGKPYTPGSYFAEISPEGRYVVFQSESPSLLPADTNDWDVFVHDIVTGTTTTPAVSDEGAVGNLGSGLPDIGADGAVVAFGSSSSNLVPGDTNSWQDVFVRERGPSTGVGALELDVAEARVTVRGWAGLSGVALADRRDPDDSEEPAPLGTELLGARIAYRPEDRSLALTLDVGGMPGVPSAVAGAPGVVHSLSFDLGAVRHEVRALRAAATAAPPGAPLFALYRCEVACVEAARLAGGYGERGEEINVTVPLTALGVNEGSTLGSTRVAAGLGEGGTGVAQAFDTIELGSLTIPRTEVQVSISGQGPPQELVVPLTDGRFEASFDRSGFPAGRYDVVARACLGQECGFRNRSVEL